MSSMTAKTTHQRMAEHRQRRKDSGLTRLELWAHPDDHGLIKDYAEDVRNERYALENEQSLEYFDRYIAGDR